MVILFCCTTTLPAMILLTAITERVGRNWKNWNTIPRLRPRQRAISFSVRRYTAVSPTTPPEVGRSIPAIMLIRVELPLPDLPMIPPNSPQSIYGSFYQREEHLALFGSAIKRRTCFLRCASLMVCTSDYREVAESYGAYTRAGYSHRRLFNFAASICSFSMKVVFSRRNPCNESH